MKNPGMSIFLVFFMAAGWPGLASVQESGPLAQSAQQRVVTTTRLVTVFSELETEWLQGVQQNDSAALERFQDQDFQELSPNVAGPVPREEWQQRALTQELRSFRLR
jgi:hypothetical protein